MYREGGAEGATTSAGQGNGRPGERVGEVV